MNGVAAILYAVASAVLAGIALAYACGGLDPMLAWAALGIGVAVGACSLRGRKTLPQPVLGGWEWAAIALFALISLRAFLWLVFTDGDEIKVLSPNNLGDLSLHLTYIRHLASGVPFWPDNPIFTGGKLTYPVGIDLLDALLALIGVDVLRGLVWVGLAGAALTGAALWRWGRAFTLLGFLCNGGVLGFQVFVEWDFRDFQAEAAWKSIPLALLVTQRGLLFALPAGLLLLSSWRSRHFGAGDAWRLPLWGEVLLYASMPVFHLHSFIFLSFVLGCWFLIHEPSRKRLLIFVGAALAPATLLTLLVTGMLKGASVIGWKPGWMQEEPGPVEFVKFWFTNFGLLPVAVAALCWMLWRRGLPRWASAMTFPALLMFLICCFVKFAPWEWDNTKIMLWSYLAVLPFIWEFLLAQRPLWMRALAIFALYWSGFASLLGGIDQTHSGHEIAFRSDLDAVGAAVRGIPVSERFVGCPTYNHPLLLVGRKMAMGYTGHAWSHGLPWGEAARQVDELMGGADEWRILAADLDVRYLFWGREEVAKYPASTQPWKSASTRVAAGEWGEIYDLKTPPSPILEEDAEPAQ